jgi:rapamycin-insensitive companion of mTOR
VLGLISSTLEGVRILERLGWDSVLNTMGTPTGLCVPQDPSKFLSLPPSPALPISEPSPEKSADPSKTTQLDAIDTEIIETVTNMISVVHAKEATRNLIKLKQRHPVHFKRKIVWLEMLNCVERWNYPLAVRRFLFTFFGQRGMIRAIGRVEGTAGESEEAESSDDDAEESEIERKPVENAGRFDV